MWGYGNLLFKNVLQMASEIKKQDKTDQSDIDRVTDEFRRCLKKKGLRVTPERECVCREVYTTSIHFDAENLIHRLQASSKPVSRATVYRTLDVLEDCGLVKKIRQTDQRHHYEKTLGLEHHDHLFCEDCGEVIEFRVDEIERLQDEVCQQYGFQPRRHSLQIYGLCRKCIAKKTKEEESLPE
jgi:Fur family ferric uptake transcriptional regulator